MFATGFYRESTEKHASIGVNIIIIIIFTFVIATANLEINTALVCFIYSNVSPALGLKEFKMIFNWRYIFALLINST